MPSMGRRQGLTASRALLAMGLMASAGLVAAVGGWWGVAIGSAQAAVAGAALLSPRSPGPLAGAVVVAVPAPLAAAGHWTAPWPVGCRCARLAHPPPSLVSVTGLAVAVDLLLVGLALWLVAAHRQAKVGKSSS